MAVPRRDGGDGGGGHTIECKAWAWQRGRVGEGRGHAAFPLPLSLLETRLLLLKAPRWHGGDWDKCALNSVFYGHLNGKVREPARSIQFQFKRLWRKGKKWTGCPLNIILCHVHRPKKEGLVTGFLCVRNVSVTKNAEKKCSMAAEDEHNRPCYTIIMQLNNHNY